MISSNHSRVNVHALIPEEMPTLATSLGDTPETVIAWYLLWTDNCNAWCVGPLHDPSAVVVQAHLMPAQPTAFGTNATHIAEILLYIDGWESLLVPSNLARDLERPIASAAKTLTINTLEDIYYELKQPVADIVSLPNVRLLTEADEALLGGSDAFTSNDLGETIIAAAIVDEEIVSLAHTFAWSPEHVDIGVMTHEDALGQGYATAAAAMVATEIMKQGRIPVWSCGATNEASIRIAAKLGFREISRKVYIIPEKKDIESPQG